jgi:hypothetical protein
MWRLDWWDFKDAVLAGLYISLILCIGAPIVAFGGWFPQGILVVWPFATVGAWFWIRSRS